MPGFVLGLTPFALIVLVLITLPLAISAAIAAKMQKASREPEEPSSRWYLAAWLMLSVVWFVLPLAMYLSSPFYYQDGWGRLLAVSVAVLLL